MGLADGLDAASEGVGVGDWAPALDFDEGLLVSLGLTVAYFVLVVLLVVLIGIALEIVVPFLLIVYGLFAGLALRRPWTVEAIDLTEPGRSATYAVKGWRRSGGAVAALSREVAATGVPSPPPGAEGLSRSRARVDGPGSSRARRRGA